MKITSKVLALLIAVSIFSCTKTSKTEYSTADTKAYLKVVPNTTESELKKITDEFKQKRNIDIDYSQSKFFDDGKIEELVLKINTNDGFSGDVNSSAVGLKLNSCGFIRDYSKEAKVPFTTGAL